MKQVFVSNKQLEGISEVDLAFSYGLKDIREVGKAKGIKSTTVKIPATKQNVKAFGITSDINVFTDLNKNAGHPCYTIEDSTVIFEGAAYLLSATEYEIEFVMIESIGVLKDILGEKMLAELDFSDLTHTYYDTDVFGSWDTELDYIYPLIDYGKFRHRSADISWTVFDELKPALKAERIIKQICRDSGITLDTKFFNHPIHKGLISAFGNSEMIHSPSWVEDRTVYVRRVTQTTYNVTGTVIDLDTIVTDPLNEFNTGTWEYTSNQGKVADLVFTFLASSVVIVPGVPPDETIIRIQVEYYDTLLAGWYDIDGAAVQVTGAGFYQINTTVNLLDTWKLRVTVNFDVVFAGSLDITDARFKITPQNVVYTDSDVELAYQLPQWKQIDFIKEIAQYFNMVVIYDDTTRTLMMNTWDDFFTGDYVDWSDKIDLDDSNSIQYASDDIPNVWNFTMDQPDNDKRLLSFNDQYSSGVLFGDGRYELTTKYGQAEDVVESKFRPVYNGRSYDTASIVPGTLYSDYIVIPNVWEKGTALTEFNYGVGPMLLIYQGMTDISILSDGTRSDMKVSYLGTTRTQIPLCYMVKKVYEDENINSWDRNLTFSMPNDKPLNQWNGRGIIDMYFSNMLTNINKYRMVKAKVNLTAQDIASLDFSKYVYIRKYNAYFIINQISQYNPDSHETTEVELIRVAR